MRILVKICLKPFSFYLHSVKYAWNVDTKAGNVGFAEKNLDKQFLSTNI